MFKPEEQSIYHYHNGEKEVSADPIKLQIKLLGYQDFSDLVKQAGTEVGEQYELERLKAFDSLADMAREVFKVPGFDMQNALKLLIDYLRFMDELKKKLNQPAALPQPMDSCQEQ